MKKFSKLIAGLLAVLITFPSAVSAFAADTPSEKEEVIYVITDASGNVTSVNAVNIFAGGNIIDYGSYSEVKMLTSNNEIKQNGDQVSFSTDDAKVYYQGTMKNVEIPWDISIRYYLDGKEYSASDIAGKSGKLEIRLSITKNSKETEDFFENYALQATLLLDTKRCENINAPDATIANVGSDKQLSYTILPGKGIDTAITADVTDFEMDAVAVNGIKLNLNVEIDDAELMDKVTQLMDATKELNNGTDKLYSNSEELKTGSGSLDSGLDSLHSGVSDLDNGIVSLQDGISSVQYGLDSLNSKSSDLQNGSAQIKAALETIQSSLSEVSVSADQLIELTNASSAIKQGINDLYDGASSLKQSLGYTQYKSIMAKNGLDIDTLKSGNTQAIDEINTQITSLQQIVNSIQGIQGYEEQVAQLQSQISSLQSVVKLLSGNNAAIGGTESYLNSLSDGVNSLYDGLNTLKTQYETFDSKIGELADTLGGMLVKLTDLSNGINTLVSKYSELDSGITEYTGGVAEITVGYTQIVDGVSSLASGSKTLISGADTLNNGAGELYDGIVAYCDGVSELYDGTNEFYTQTSEMDKQVQEQIDELLASIGGDETETVSFVSEKNTNIDSVQFVIKTSAVEKAEIVETDEKEEEHLSFWQKLLRLFGLY